VAVVTGAARGIGAATALRLAARGWSVVAVDVASDVPAVGYPLATPGDLEDVVRRGDGAITAHIADVRDRDGLAEAVSLAEHRGDLVAAVAAAGVIAGGGPHWEVDTAAERAVLDIDLGGVMNLARVAMPALLRSPEPRSGRFLAVASAAATRGLPNLAAYCAAKAGVGGFIRALAAELRGTGVTANAVSPGSTRTDILAASAELYDLPSRDAFASQQPIERLIEPDEIAAVLEFLAGPGGDAMTGAVVPVDGGLSL